MKMAKTRSSRLKQNAGTEKEKADQQNKVYLIVSFGLIAAGFIILVEQYVHWGVLYDPEDTLHHEVFFLIFISIGGGILIGRFAFARKCNNT